jgi:hypothetical protein
MRREGGDSFNREVKIDVYGKPVTATGKLQFAFEGKVFSQFIVFNFNAQIVLTYFEQLTVVLKVRLEVVAVSAQ